MFQKTIQNKYIKAQGDISEKWQLFKNHFHNPSVQENIRNSKEEQYQGEFLIDLFVNILGYTKNPNPNFNLTTELKNEKNSKKADGAIIINDNVKAVIELKGTNTTDLGKVENQAFGYKNNQRNCSYVIISNFEKLRFYIDNAINHIEFNLFTLTEDEFNLLYLLLSLNSITNDIPKKLKAESISQEDVITKKLYKDYSVFKRELFANLCALNSPPTEGCHDSGGVVKRNTQNYMQLPYNPDLKNRARELRKAGNLSEVLFWQQVRNKGFKGLDFDRQKIIGNYIVDFYCASHNVVVEIDGSSHDDKYEYDKKRDDFLENLGLTVIHIADIDVKTKLTEVMEFLFNHPALTDTPPTEGNWNLLLFKKSQKLLDRFLFLFFAEDSYLLPPNSVREVLKQWEQLKELDAYTPLYERFKKYFGYLNTGFKGKKHDIFAYNGGLFKPDEILDTVTIDDEILYKHTKTLSEYDFNSEVDVNILGHIFENSLNEIDEIQNELQGKTTDKTQTKRKQDGVFYTPKYITKYIVENTVGKLCDEKKNKLQIDENEYITDKRRQKKTITHLLQKLKDYRAWLLELTICDPACGSGAFLNEALNFLIAEHKYLDELETKLLGGGFTFPNIENSILENNIFGVDINEESVEIAKLSLWLRTAQPNRKLNNLNENIKCGNSLISDPEIAEEKAFDWQKEFPKVFEKGGFDVVIGNPPYVKLEQIKQTSEQLEQMNYQTYAKRGDLYVLFVEKGFKLLKSSGFLSYIMPNKWLQADYGKYLRKYFLENNILELIDFGDLQVFEGATTYPCIFNSQKDKPNDTIKTAILNKNLKDDFDENIKQNQQLLNANEFDENTWVISSAKDKAILDKICNKFEKLEGFVKEANYGVKTGLSKAFFVDESFYQETQSKYLKPFVQGRDLSRYKSFSRTDSYLILFEKGFTQKQNIDNENEGEQFLAKTETKIYEWLLPFKEKAKKRTDKGDFWWELRACDYYHSFEKPKIMYQTFQVKPCFIFDESGLYCNNSMWIIPSDDKGLLAVLNSKMGWWLISKYCTQIQNGYQLIWKYFGQIPIAPPSAELAEKADEMLQLNKELQEVSSKFVRTLQRKFEQLEKLPKKLADWYLLSFAEFVKELKKKKIKLTLSEESEWEDYFLAEQQKAVAMQTQITQTDKQIDAIVYELYGLSEEEIKVVENG